MNPDRPASESRRPSNDRSPAEPNVPLRIALISRRYPPLIGGAEKVLSYLAPALANEGANVVVLTARVGDAPRFEQNGEGLSIVRLPTVSARFVGTLVYMNSLKKWLARNRVDLAYVSMLKHDAFSTIAAGRARGFPVVLRPEGAGETGDVAWQGWGRFGKTIARRCRTADAFVAVSESIERELIAAGYDPARIVSLPNGVPVPNEPWRPRIGWSDRPKAVFVGRLAPEKDLETLLLAWKLVVEKRPGAFLEMVGEGPERPRLEAAIGRLGLAESATLAGASDNPTDRLRNADLFTLSSYEEGMSIALLEAMAVGIPIVATAIPGNRRLIEHLTHGRLAPPRDPLALAGAILDQWADFDRAAATARAARERVVREFSIERMARDHLAFFRRLLARGRTETNG